MSYEFKWPVYGHSSQTQFLKSLILQKRLANAYLFYGPAGLGKKFVADFFVRSFYCQSDSTKPCGQCQNCLAIGKKIFFDLYKLGDREELSIDNIRGFLQKLSLSSLTANHKIALIYGADTINLFGANALLKTLEEPPAKTTLILISDSIENLPATVLSRCQLLKFRPISRQNMLLWLENFDFSPAERETIVNLSFGRPGLALKIMEDNLAEFKKANNFIIKMLSGSRFNYMQTLDKWFEILKKENPDSKISDLGSLTKKYLAWLELILRDLLYLKLKREPVNEIYQTELTNIAKDFSQEGILKNLLSLDKAKQRLDRNASPQLLWENLFLEIK
ncbi:MAG: hypothetical protein PHO91_03575 [Patescibacteria group bacterium]|nr:hypothetical protein [Patescibacteria group bacterium]